MGAGGLLLILPRGRAGDLLVQRQVAGGKVEAQRGKAGGEMLGQFGPHVDPATIGMIDPDAPGVDRQSVGEGKSVSVRVDLGCRRSIKKTIEIQYTTKEEIKHNI